MAEVAVQVAIKCQGVTKAYGDGDTRVAALRGVDLEVHAGTLLMIVGPSGCGKTTLVSIIAGILDRDGGDCTVFGQDFAGMDRRARSLWRGKHIGIVFQSFNLLPTLTAAQNVAVPLMLKGEAHEAAVRRARRGLAVVGLGHRTEKLPSRLSTGEQQRVAIARALIHEPGLILCDEPTSSLDHDAGRSAMKLLREVAITNDRALVVVTHDPRIFGFADLIARMDDGRIEEILDGPAGGSDE